jgi:putative solute:sodium symporter small subunit
VWHARHGLIRNQGSRLTAQAAAKQGEKGPMALVENVRHSPTEPAARISQATAVAYWRKTSGLMWLMLAIWVVAGFAVHLFAPSLNAIHVFGFPLGFYMAAQGSLIIFVLQLFWFAKAQNRIDEEFGVAEE